MIKAEPYASVNAEGYIGQFQLVGFWRTVRGDDGAPTIYPTEKAAIDAARAEWASRSERVAPPIPHLQAKRRRAA